MADKDLDAILKAIEAGQQTITLHLVPIGYDEKIERDELIFRVKTFNNPANLYGFLITEGDAHENESFTLKVRPLHGGLTGNPRLSIARDSAQLYRVSLSPPPAPPINENSINKKKELDILF